VRQLLYSGWSKLPKTVLITGVSQGLGQALFEAFLDDGWRASGTVRSKSDEWISEMRSRFTGNADVIRLDTADHDASASITKRITEPLDVLINSAATFAGDAFTIDTAQPAAMMSAYAVNVVGPLVLARALKAQLAASRLKLVIMMSTGNASLSGNVTGRMIGYRASKSALNQIVRCMAIEWKDVGITSVALNPGWVRTRMGGENAPLSARMAAQNILSFVRTAGPELNGRFVNTDGTDLPW
jgi:NAD(P)-dependent dehydrogenase (short-subunit alcohol dehydrogenase family)